MQHPDTLVELLLEKAESRPDFPVLRFLTDGESAIESMTYGELAERAKALGAALQHQGLQGQRILLLFPQNLDYLVALFGCFFAGATAVPAYPPRNNRNLKRLIAIMEDCSGAAILTDVAGQQKIHKIDEGFTQYPLLALEQLLEEDKEWQGVKAHSNDIAYLQYTSGSTGKPKGVMVTHGNVLHNTSRYYEAVFGTESDHSCLTWTPLYHDMGLIVTFIFLKYGHPLYFMTPAQFVQKPIRWMQALSRFRITYSFGPNFAYDLCSEKARKEDMEGLDLSQLRSIMSGSEMIRLSTISRFYDTFKDCGFKLNAYSPGYGMAETTLAVSHSVPGRAPSLRRRNSRLAEFQAQQPDEDYTTQDYFVSSGKLLGGCEVAIVEPEQHTPTLEGEEGEIWVHFPGSVTAGYWNKPEVTRESFGATIPGGDPEKGYFRTGDKGFLISDELFITGRIKEMVIIRGSNYYPYDIEHVVEESHPDLEANASAAFAIEGEDTERLVVAAEVKRSAWRTVEPEAVFEAARRAVANEFEIGIHQMVLLLPKSLPKTSSGKTQRLLCRRQFQQGELRALAQWQAPEQEKAPTEEAAGNWTQEQILDWLLRSVARRAGIAVAEVQPNGEMADYPLESVDAAEMAEELSKLLGFPAEAEAFWALPSIEALAEFFAKKYEAAKS